MAMSEMIDVKTCSTLCIGAVYGAVNKGEQLRDVLETSLDLSNEQWYETLLQLYLFAGFPAALESLSILSSVRKQPLRLLEEEYDVDLFSNRGEALCRRIYRGVYEQMTVRLQSISPELTQWMIVEGYGKTLSRNGLHIGIRELTIVAVLAALGWRRQLLSHVRGAMNAGVESSLLLEILSNVYAVCENVMAVNYSEIESMANEYKSRTRQD